MKKYILTIDTGTEFTAYALYNRESKQLADRNWLPNQEVIAKLPKYFEDCDICIIEMSAIYGPCSMNILANTLIIGIYAQLAKQYSVPVALMFRKTVKMELCNSVRGVNDSVINNVVRDYHFGEPGCKSKKNLNPFYFNSETEKNNARKELENNQWAALAILAAYLHNPKCIGHKSQIELKKIDSSLLEYLYGEKDKSELL